MVGDGTWLSVSEAVERLEGLVAEQKVRRLCDDGTLEAIRLDGDRRDRRILTASVDAYLTKLKGSSAASERPRGAEHPPEPDGN